MKKSGLVFVCLLYFILKLGAQDNQIKSLFFVDTHNDVLSKQIITGADLTVKQPDLNFDLIKAAEGKLRVQVFSIWCDEIYGKGKAFAVANREIDSLIALVNRNPEKIAYVTNSRQLKKAIKQQKFAAMIGVEGGHMIEERMDYLDSLINRGMKYFTLTWNNSTTWATSARDEETKRDSLPHVGLTAMGNSIVTKLNAAGVMIDVSHLGEQSFGDVIKLSTKPIIASHSCAWALSPHRRNLKDSQLSAIAKNGGVVFVNFYSEFLDSSFAKKRDAFVQRHKTELDSLTNINGDIFQSTIKLFANYPAETELLRPPLSMLVKHIDYIVRLIGVNHVGLGADYDGAESFPLQMDDVSRYPLLIAELRKFGYSNRDIKKIAHGNFMRVLRANESR